jgi:hypothetical protein
MSSAPESFTPTEIDKLKGMIEKLDRFASENRGLTKKLGLKNKFTETVGEGMGLILCFERFGPLLSYSWPGRRRTGYDIALRRVDGREARIQVKTNTDRAYSFKLFNMEVGRETRNQMKAGSTEAMFRSIDNAVQEKKADFWMLIHAPESGSKTFYILDKDRIKAAIKRDFQIYYDKPHTRRYHFGVGRTGSIWFMLNKGTVDSLRDYEKDWSPISKKLGL